MADNKGKEFEKKFKEDFLKIPGATIDRLYDPVAGFYGIKNVCDFIGYIYPFIFYLECKSTHENTFSLNALTQYDELIKKKGIKGTNAGVVIWFIEKQQVVWVSIEEFERIKNAGYKSINVKMAGDPAFKVLKVPGIIKRTFIDNDYSLLMDEATLKLKEF